MLATIRLLVLLLFYYPLSSMATAASIDNMQLLGKGTAYYLRFIKVYDDDPEKVCDNCPKVEVDIWVTEKKLEIWECNDGGCDINKKTMQLDDSFLLSNDCILILKRIQEDDYESGREQRRFAIFEQKNMQEKHD